MEKIRKLSFLKLIGLTFLLFSIGYGCSIEENNNNLVNVIEEEIPLPQEEDLISKADNTILRIASYNVFQSNIFKGNNNEAKGDRYQSWTRMVKALDVDIWVLQELFYNDKKAPASYAEDLISHMNDITGQNDWSYSSDLLGRVLLTRYKVKWNAEIRHRVHATWVSLPKENGTKELLIINVHYHRDTDGQAEDTKDFIRDVRNGHSSGMPKDISIIVCGDFNTEPASVAYKTIANEGFIDVKPLHNGIENERTTHGKVVFKNGEWDISPNKSEIKEKVIDFVFYDLDKLTLNNSFILNTIIMNDELLNKHSLNKADIAIKPEKSYNYNNSITPIECDHFPIVVDFRQK